MRNSPMNEALRVKALRFAGLKKLVDLMFT